MPVRYSQAAASRDKGIGEIGRDRLAERVCLSLAQLLHTLWRYWAHCCSSQTNDQLRVEARVLSGMATQIADDARAQVLTVDSSMAVTIYPGRYSFAAQYGRHPLR